MTPLHLNRHRPVTADVPFFALVDRNLIADALRYRWMTSTNSLRPVRVYYDRTKGRPVTESLARWVWTQVTGVEAPPLVGHVDGDLLNCTMENLKALHARSGGKHVNTGAGVKRLQLDVAAYRLFHNIPAEGEKVTTGRPLPGTPAQHEQVRELRKTVGKNMSLAEFNHEIVAEELGKPLSWRGLKTLLSA